MVSGQWVLDLEELFEDPPVVAWIHAYAGVLYGNSDRPIVFGESDLDVPAVRCELDGIL